MPNQPDATDPINHRWPYSSSYLVGQPFFCPDAVTATTDTIVPTSYFGALSIFWANFGLGGRRASEVAFPSQKVHIFDVAQWQGGNAPVFFAYSFARIPLLLVDGSAKVRLTGQANPGFQPLNPRSAFPTLLTYSPQAWDAPLLPGLPSSFVMSYYWTRGGIQGRDFDGQEISTGIGEAAPQSALQELGLTPARDSPVGPHKQDLALPNRLPGLEAMLAREDRELIEVYARLWLAPPRLPQARHLQRQRRGQEQARDAHRLGTLVQDLPQAVP